jgi:hypothetical protein
LTDFGDSASADSSSLHYHLMSVYNVAADENPDKFDVKCYCKEGYSGAKCEKCADGWFGNPSMINQYCERCDCNGNSDMSTGNVQCDSLDGTCLACAHGTSGKNCEMCEEFKFGDAEQRNCQDCTCEMCGSVSCDNKKGHCECKANVIGENCDKCAMGFWNFDSCLETGCQDCACDSIGALDTYCNQSTGECVCKQGVGGAKCDQCLPGHFNIQDDGCTKCDCPDYLPCDSLTGTCFCPEGITGKQCTQCENSRNVPVLFEGKTKCEKCDQCINWLLGPADDEIWHDEKIISKSIQPWFKNVTDRIHDVNNTKAGGLAKRKLENLNKKYVEIKSFAAMTSNKNEMFRNAYIPAIDNFSALHEKLLHHCKSVHESEKQIFDLDESYSVLIIDNTAISLEYDDTKFKAIALVKSLENKSQQDKMPLAEIEDKVSELERMALAIEDLSKDTSLEKDVQLSNEMLAEVQKRYNTTKLITRANRTIYSFLTTEEKIEILYEILDETIQELSKVVDLNQGNESKVANLRKDMTTLNDVISNFMKNIKSGIQKNVESQTALTNIGILMKSTITNITSFETENQFERMRNVSARIRSEINQPNSTDIIQQAEKVAASITKVFVDFQADFNRSAPKLQDKIDLLKVC